jgi:uncharacterized membrane protein
MSKLFDITRVLFNPEDAETVLVQSLIESLVDVMYEEFHQVIIKSYQLGITESVVQSTLSSLIATVISNVFKKENRILALDELYAHAKMTLLSS